MLTPWEVDGKGDLIPATGHYLFFLSKHGPPKASGQAAKQDQS